MKPLRLLLVVPLLAACATLGIGGGATPPRQLLYRQAFVAYTADSVKAAQQLFYRVVSEYPNTHEAHESRYFLGLLALDPRGTVDLRAADEHLGIYLTQDTMKSLRGAYRREAMSLRRLTQVLRSPCSARTGSSLPCDTTVVSRTVTVPGDAPPASSGAEVQRLQSRLRDRDNQIRDLQAELERIRATLAPRP